MSKSNKYVKKPVHDESSDNEDKQVKNVETKKSISTSNKASKNDIPSINKVENESSDSEDDDLSDSEDEQPVKETVTNVDEQSDDDSDDEQDTKQIISDASDEESEDKTVVNKKMKETTENIKNRIKARKQEIKVLTKTKSDQLKGLKETETSIKEKERQQRSDYDLLEKSHESDLKRVRSEKPKRKGNVNGGFNKEQPVPEILRNFLNLPDDAALPRPKVVAALHNKFKELALKDKQTTKIDAATAKKLGLDGPVDISFGAFQTWLAAFYPKDETKVVVEVDV